MQQQVSPQPTGPSYKKPFSIFILLTDELYTPTLMSLISLIGTGTVFGIDQPIDFRLVVNSQLQITPLWLSSGFTIPNTIRIYDQAQFDSNEGMMTVFKDLNLAILATQSHTTLQSLGEKFASLITPSPAITQSPSPEQQQHQQQTQPVYPPLIPTSYSNTKIFITTPLITQGCEIFTQSSLHPNPALIHGFALHYETLLLSQLITQLNSSIKNKALHDKYPYINIKSIHNTILRATSSTPSKNHQTELSFNLTYAMVTNYPSPNSLTPLGALLSIADIKPIGTTTNLPSLQQQLQSPQNPLSPFPLLIAQHLKQWFGFTQRGVYFNACIATKGKNNNGDKITFELRPIATYYGNTSTSILFD